MSTELYGGYDVRTIVVQEGTLGAAGVGITTTVMDAAGHLIVTKTDGTETDVGKVRADITPEVEAARDAVAASAAAATQATEAAEKASEQAETAMQAAQGAAGTASEQAGIATDKAGEAGTSASQAAGSANAAALSASSASGSATAASKSAGQAAGSAADAASAATTATTMAGQTVALQDAAVASIARDTSSQTRAVINDVSAVAGAQAAVQTLADQPEVVTAAAELAQSNAELVRGVPGSAPLAVGGIVDASGNVTELVFDRDGQVPESIVRAWRSRAGIPSIDFDRVVTLDVGYVTDAVGGLTDQSGNLTELVFDRDGQVPENILMAWARRMDRLGRSVLPITCWGDSQTGNDNSSALMWTKVMATGLGVAVANKGFPGETSAGIAAKSGAIPAVWRSGGTIPASGSVSVVLADHVKVMLWWHPMKCSIAGVHGVLSRSPNISGGTPSEDYPAVFTRDTSGEAVMVPAYAPFIPDDVSLRGNMTIIMAGRNNTGDPARVLSDTAAMIDFLTGTDRKWAVLSQITGSGRDAINDGLKAAYGRHCWDALPYLVSTQALSDAGITPTQADLDAIAAGNIPPSFTSDGVHLNDAGLTVQGTWVAQKVIGALWLQ
ncbi:hypothetical protein [Changpingibacter yushuensis]|uniref:hypothetical protein n=1 Tax=Changpingibacter yushuensis TaxID=2758440 RepID=UPI00165E9B62|nr:hypothetical protein [Changpingibacter yushuensis]